MVRRDEHAREKPLKPAHLLDHERIAAGANHLLGKAEPAALSPAQQNRRNVCGLSTHGR